MASWITHMMIADRVLKSIPSLDARGYCAGSIAPDCNVENETWTAFTPPREVTHWMQSGRKTAADCDRFRGEYLLPHLKSAFSAEETSFFLGYYSHLIEDAEFQRYIRDEDRVKAVWRRIHADQALSIKALSLPETWDSAKQLISRDRRQREIDRIEAGYLKSHPNTAYLTVILPMTSFPDYADFLPPGSIVRKIRIMGRIPADCSDTPLLSISEEEYASYVNRCTGLVLDALKAVL